MIHVHLHRSGRPGLLQRCVELLLLCLALLLFWLGAAWAEDGEWIDLATLRQDVRLGPQIPPDSAPPAAVESSTSPQEAGSPPLSDGDWLEVSRGRIAPTDAEAPPHLPRSFYWQGGVAELGRVGYVYLGDYYFVEERDYDRAEKAYRHALDSWPRCGPLLTRVDLLQAMQGDWLLCAEAMQVGLDEGLPPAIRHEYGLDKDSPLLSDEEADVPFVPAMLFRIAMENLPRLEPGSELAAPRAFLQGRLLSYLGEYEEALRLLAPVALDEEASPWNFQAASQRAELYLASWRPELAYLNLLQTERLAGQHPALLARIGRLREALALRMSSGEGAHAQETVRLLGRQEQGHWILSPPETEFMGKVEVVHVEGESLEPDAAEAKHLIYRGGDYWLLALPLGSPDPGWRPGLKVTLLGETGKGS